MSVRKLFLVSSIVGEHPLIAFNTIGAGVGVGVGR